jgi:translocation and assembly module TamB
MAENEKVRLSRFPWWFWVVMAGLFLVLVVCLGWFLQSPAFKEIVRERVITELEKITGGTVELKSLSWNVSRLEVEATGITIHGLEPAGDEPLAHADRLYARMHVVSLLSADIDLRQLTLEKPLVHVIVKPDGSTNVPAPKVKGGGDPLQELFNLAIGRAEVKDGTLIVNQERVPLDFKANDIGLVMAYHLLERRYDATLHVGKIDVRPPEMRAIPAIADAEFSLWRNRLQVRSLKLVSEKSSLELTGTVDDFQHPRVQASYQGSFDLVQVGSIARVPKLRGGNADIAGSGTLESSNVTASGKLSLRNVTYDEPGFEVLGASASTEYSLDRERILLKKIAGRMLGGALSGDAEVKHYAPALETASAEVSADTPAKSRKGSAGGKPALAVEQGTAHFKVSGASLAEVVRMLGSRDLPLEKLNPVASVDGTIAVTWKESVKRAVLDIAASAGAPTQVEAGRLPVTGSFRGQYDIYSGTTTIASAVLATPHTELSGSGMLGTRTAQLKIAANTNDLGEFEPLLTAMGQSRVPVEINGRASFDGSVSGPLAHPDIAGRLLATDFTYLYTPAAAPVPAQTPTSKLKSIFNIGNPQPEPKPAPVERRIHLDSLAGDIQYGNSLVSLQNGVIAQGAAHLNVDGSAHLSNGDFTDSSPFEAQVQLRNATMSDLQQTIGVSYPVSGTVNLSLQLSGTKADPHGKGTLSVSGGEVYGYPLKTASSDIVVGTHEAQLQNLKLEGLSGHVEGVLAYELDSRHIRADLRGENLELAQIRELQSAPIQESGVLSFTLQSSGTMEKPVVNAHVEVANMAINSEIAGSLVLDAVTEGDRLRISGQSKFSHGSLSIDGTVLESGDFQSDMRLQFSQVDIDPLLTAELRTHVTGHSSLNGRANVSGPLRQPRLIKGSIEVESFSVELERIGIQSDGPIELALDDGVIAVKKLGLTSQDTKISLGGTIDLKGDRPLDLYARGHLNMAVFHALDDEITSYGTSDGDVTVKGTIARPLLNGRVVIAHAGFSVIDLPAALGEMNGTMVFNQDRLEVEKLSGRVGGGQVSFSGFISYGSTIGFDLRSQGTDIRFRYAGVSITADQELRLYGTLKSSSLTGEVTITRFAQIPATDISAAFAPQAPELPNPASPLNNLRLDVRITSAPELTVQTTLAKLSGDVDLKLRGTGTRPTLLGRINVAEGDINLNGTKYHLDRGDVTFANPVRIDPILDVEATTRVRDFDITIGLHGTLEKLTTTYRSDPPLSSDDIISLLAFGRTQEEGYYATGRSNGLGEGAGNLVLGSLINQTVSNRASKLFGVSSIRINPAVGGPDNNPSARITIEQQVSNNVTLTYITNLTQSAQQVIQFEYNINSEYTVQGIRDENGVVSFDLLIRKRKK